MSRRVLFHLHFAAPPFENPWLGAETSPIGAPVGAPLEQLTKEVFGAHSASRVLNAVGDIAEIVTTYAWISFSFATDVLRFLRVNATNVYNRILDSDRHSLEDTGAGNAVATSYSGAILPLLLPEEIALDIKLGLASFRDHFRRDASGFWCPELALSNAVADALVSEGVRYTFLSPWQIQAVSREGSGVWTPLGPHPYSVTGAVRLKRPGGTLLLLPYDERLHHDIEGRSVLKSSRLLEKRLLEAQAPDNLITVVHEADLFGHREPYADMCLADLIHRHRSGATLRFINGGNLLGESGKWPLAKLRRGEGEFGSSWSCSHGVARWYRDCGCRASSEDHWHQRWRVPLRALLRQRHTRVWSLVKLELCKRGLPLAETALSFLALAEGRLDAPEWLVEQRCDAEILPYLEALFTSALTQHAAAWHYGDPSQDPTLRALAAAFRVEELLDGRGAAVAEYSLEKEAAQLESNIPGKGGAWIVQTLQTRARFGADHAAAFFIMEETIGSGLPGSARLGRWVLASFRKEESSPSPDRRVHFGHLVLCNTRLPEERALSFRFVEDFRDGFTLVLADAPDGPERIFELTALEATDRQNLAIRMSRQLEEKIVPLDGDTYNQLKKVAAWTRFLGQVVPRGIQALLEGSLMRRLLSLGTEPQDWEGWNSEIRFALENNLELDTSRLRKRLSYLISVLVAAPDSFTDSSNVQSIERLLTNARTWGFEPDLTVAQNMIWSVLKRKSGRVVKEIKEGSPASLTVFRNMLRCARVLGLETLRWES